LRAAQALGLETLLERRPEQLSGGQRQRVALGRAIVREPAVFLMDEPLSNLDAKLRVQTRAELVELQRRLSATIIYVTHDQIEAMALADRVAVMNDGVLQQVGPPSEVYLRPANLFVAQFVGSPVMNTLPATLSSAGGIPEIRVAGEGFPLPASAASGLAALPEGRSLVLGIRPEGVRLAREEGPGMRPMEAHLIEPLGAYDIVDLALGDRYLKARTPSGFVRGRGDRVWAELDAGQVHFFDAESGQSLGVRL